MANAAPQAKLRIFHALHRRYPSGDYETWKYVRFAAELGYEVTLVKDATADYSDDEMQAALDISIPRSASAIVTTAEIVESLSSLST